MTSGPDAQPTDLVTDASDLDAATDARPALVLALSVYGHHAAWLVDEWYLKTLDPGLAVILPIDGTLDAGGQYAFNASHSCCDATGSNDDEARLVTAVRERIAVGDVAPGKVWVWGESNGGLMAWRLACDHADLFAGAVVLSGAGASASDAPCAPSQPIAILDVHGTADDVIHYDQPWHLLNMPDLGIPETGLGGTLDQTSHALWCGSAPEVSLHARDVATSWPGAETDELHYACTRGALDHWRVNGAGHLPSLVPSWPTDVLAWSTAHSR